MWRRGRAAAIALVAAAAWLLSGVPAALGEPPGRESLDARVVAPVYLPGIACDSCSPSAGAALPWYRTWGGPKADQAWAVVAAPSGAIYYGAYQQFEGQLFTDMVIYRLDAAGNTTWQTRWGGNFQEKLFIAALAEPVVYVAGLTQPSAGLEDADMAFLALDTATGAILWERTWGGPGYEEADGLLVDGNRLLATGWSDQGAAGMEAAILALDRASGNVLWSRTWGGPKVDHQDGTIAIVGDAVYASGLRDGVNLLFGGDAFVAKLSRADGSLLKQVTWGGANFDDGLGLAASSDAIYVTGLTLSHGQGGQIFLLKYSFDLDLQWARTWGGAQGESARTVLVDPEGNILVAGHTFSMGNGANDIVLLKYTPAGELVWAKTWGGADGDDVFGASLRGDLLYLAGQTRSVGAGMNDALLLAVDWRTGAFSPQPIGP